MADPTDEDLRAEFSARIAEHLQKRKDSDLVRDLWRGYLQALTEWNIVSRESFENLIRLVAPLKPIRLPFVEIVRTDSQTGMITTPTGDELAQKMAQSIEDHDDDDTINALWQGYLTALQEWRSLRIGDFDYRALSSLPKDLGRDEINEIFLGFPDDDAS